ncbi:hypothetical protein EJ357_42145 [Streptomyces cyaneochromogenes]|uniref:Uncharacterized protein n=1 Tax=Streptomyces cyaneochromogenes TaxID=2496836 RepID=A0A3S9MJ77_9ACTN|nr:hypothetical protein [Streptomyces cyaneochromogenes]AZQ39232.1 hypothetical protein EJ357_42145 [Streptomyces cyaneochromogenes]
MTVGQKALLVGAPLLIVRRSAEVPALPAVEVTEVAADGSGEAPRKGRFRPWQGGLRCLGQYEDGTT